MATPPSTAAQDGAGSVPVPTQASLRRLLREMLRDDADLDELCSDYFVAVKSELTLGMQRSTKLTLLLERASHPRILEALQEWRPDAFDTHRHLLRYEDPARASAEARDEASPAYTDEGMRELGVRLEELYEKEGELRASAADPQSIRQVVAEQLSIRRDMRSGPSLRVGEYLDGRYKILEKLGRGGFATVWKAFDRHARRVVAVKVLLGDWAGDKTRIERFERGARLMEGLDHPAIVRILASSTESGGYHYFVMNYIDDGDLYRAVLKKKIDEASALDAILQAGDALQFAHDHGVIHRDVKPQNILLDMCGKALVTDFDLATAADTTGGTRTGALGTFLYSSPEAMSDAATAGPAADVYSLAMTTLFALRGGELPFNILREMGDVIDRLNCRSKLKRVLRDGTAWEVPQRIQSVRELCARIEDAATGADLVPDVLQQPPLVCILAAGKDYDFEEEFLIHLSPFVQARDLRVWSRHDLRAGEYEDDKFRAAIETATLILCLVSADFLVEDSARAHLALALSRATEIGARVVPVLIRATVWRETSLGRLMPLPENGVPVAQSPNRDQAWAHVARGVLALVAQSPRARHSVPQPLVHLGPVETSTAPHLPGEHIKVFIVASPADDELAAELFMHLSGLAPPERAIVATTSMFPAGESWGTWGLWVRERMSSVDVVLLMLSPDFLANEELGVDVLRHAESLRSAGRTHVWLVLARPAVLHAADLAFAVLPPEGDFITTRADRDEAWAEVARRVFRDLPSEKGSGPSLDHSMTKEDVRPPRERETKTAAVRMTVIYSPEDLESLQQFEIHAAFLVSTGKIEIHRRPTRGEDVSASPLERADMVVWLVSADLLADDSLEEDMEKGVQRVREGSQKMAVVRLRPCHIEGPLSRIPAFPKDRGFVHTKPNRDSAWVQVWLGIREICGV